MAPIDLNLVRAFVAVYDGLSFSKAAAQLAVPRSTVSRAVGALERSLNTELFRRTTRSVVATAEARALYDRVAPSMAGLDAALQPAPAPREDPTGTLRITTTGDLGSALLAEAAVRFAARYPRVEIDVNLSNEVIDLVREDFDLALRVSVKPLRNSATLIARKVGVVRAQLFASPGYLARHGSPRTTGELSEHERIGFHRVRPGVMEPRRVVGARIHCDDMLFAREVARHDGGIAILPSFITGDDVANGTLVRVLPAWTEFTGSAWLVHPASKNVPARVSAFRALTLELLRQRPLE